MNKVDGNKTGIYDGIVTIFCGYGDTAKIKRFILTANGTKDDKFITLNDCLAMIGSEDNPVTVIFEDWTCGEIYNYGKYLKKCWVKTGITVGYA